LKKRTKKLLQLFIRDFKKSPGGKLTKVFCFFFFKCVRPKRLATLLAFARATNADFVADDLALYDAAAGRVTGSGGAAAPEQPITLRDYFAHNLANGAGLDWGFLKPFMRRATLLELGLS